MKRIFIVVILLFVKQLACCAADHKPDGNRLTGKEFSFRENKGQVVDQLGAPRPDIQFQAVLPGVTLFIGNGLLHYQFSEKHGVASGIPKANPKNRELSPENTSVDVYRLDVELLNANPDAIVTAEDITESKDNYFLGYSASGITDVRSFRKIVYHNIYPGIDWVIYTKGQELKYDFIVHPGANPGAILLRYKGGSALRLTSAGALEAKTPFGSITEQKPVAYEQESHKNIPVRFSLDKDVLSFNNTAYKGTLVIDPLLSWSTYFGGEFSDDITGVSSDANGNVSFVGSTESTVNIATTGAYQTTLSGFNDIMVAQFNDAGVRQWATYFGGSDRDFSQGIAVDLNNNIYICGYTRSTSGIATAGSFQSAYGSAAGLQNTYDGFLAKFNSSGLLQWSTYYGGSARDYGRGVACDAAGNVYLVGQTKSSNAIATTGSYQPAYGGGNGDAFLVKFNDQGLQQWGTYFGAAGTEAALSVATDNAGDVYIAGNTDSDLGIATPGSHQPAITTGSTSAFLGKFSGAAGALLWSTYYGDYAETGNSVAVDKINNLVYLAGSTYSGTVGIATPGSYQPAMGGGSYEGFLAQFDLNGVRQWGTYYGGNADEECNAVSCDAAGNVFVAGYTSSTNGIATANGQQTLLTGNNDGFIAEFNSAGTRQWGTYFGGTENDNANAVVCANTGAVYLAGNTGSSSGIATPGSYQPVIDLSLGSGDAFLARYGPGNITCLVPSSLTAVAQPGGVTALLDWTENGSATQWIVEYGAPGFTAGTGTSVPVSTHPYLLGGLTPNQTAYEFRVRSFCTVGDTSAITAPAGFITTCVALTIPYMEGFESAPVFGQMPACMSVSTAAVSTDIVVNTGVYAAKFQFNGSNFDTLFTQPIQLTAGTTYQLSLWFKVDGNNNYAPMVIKYGTQPSGDSMTHTITDIPNVTTGTNTTGAPSLFKQLVTNFTPATTGVYYLGIATKPNPGNIGNLSYYVYVDDISIIQAPGCTQPDSLVATVLTDTSVSIDWTSFASVGQWDVQYGTPGFVPGTGTNITTASHPYVLNGLSPATTYDVYVKLNCGPGSSSSWRGPFRFTTLCTPAVIPFNEGFETATTDDCDMMVDANEDGYTWSIGSLFAYSGNAMLNSPLYYNYPYNGPDSEWYYTKGIYLDAGVTYQLSFWYRASVTGFTEKLNVYAGQQRDITAMTATAPVFEDTAITNVQAYNKAITSFTPTTSGIYFLGFYNYNVEHGKELYIDDIRLTVADVTVSGIVAPSSDTLCTTPAQELSVQLANNGLSDNTDSIHITAVYGTTGFSDTLTGLYTDTLFAGGHDTVALGNMDLSIPGVYQISVYIDYLTGDTSKLNDTLSYTLVVPGTPSVAGIVVTGGGSSYSFSADNAQQVTDYSWDFGDGTALETTSAPAHTYAGDGSYTVTLIAGNLCGSDTVTALVQVLTGIDATWLNQQGLMIYPNPAKDYIIVSNTSTLAMESITIYNSAGAVVYSQDRADARQQRISTAQLANGIYLVRIRMEKGYLVRRLELNK